MVNRIVTAVLSLVDRVTVLVKSQIGYDGEPATLAADRAMPSLHLEV